MRTLNTQHRNIPKVPRVVPNQKDENLASIMERRRAVTDSGSGDDAFSVSSTTSRDTRSSMRSDLYEAMQRRRRVAKNTSVRSMVSQQSGMSMESGTQADDEYDSSYNNIGKAIKEEQNQESAAEFEYEYEVDQEAYTDDDQEYATEDEQPYTEDDNRYTTEEDQPDTEDDRPYTSEDQPDTEDEQPYSSDDDQPYSTAYSENAHYEDENPYSDDGYSDDQQEHNRSGKFSQDSQSDYEYEENIRDGSNNDSFFADATYGGSIDDSAWETSDQQSYGPGRTLGTLRTLSEENSNLVRSEESTMDAGDSAYEEETIQTFADGRSYAGRSVAESTYADQSYAVTELVSTDDDYEHGGSSNYSQDSGENDPVYEIDTVDTSVVSSDNDSAWVSENGRSRGSLLDHFNHQNPPQPPPAIVDYTLDENNSILGELSVLDAVKEESTDDGMLSRESSARTPLHMKRDAVIKEESERDDSTNYGESVMTPKSHKSGFSKDSGYSYSMNSQSTGNTPTDGLQASFVNNDDLESQQTNQKNSSFVNQDDLESVTTTSAYRNSKKKRKPLTKKGPEVLCCPWPWIIVLVLIISIGAGVGVGLLYFGKGGDNDNEPVPPALELPSLTPKQLEAYELICPLLESDCESTLLNIATPQGQAFDWLVNNEEANPDLSDTEDSRIVRRYALATFYYSTIGEQWKTNTGWLSDMHECDWFATAFATCDRDRSVFHSIAMNGNNVQGELPYELSLLSDLTSIVIQNPADTAPYLRGALPSELGRLTKLSVVKITGNLFSSGIPREFGSWKDIQTLDLSNNGLNGEIHPASFASCPKLMNLNLEGNYLAGSIPSELFIGAPNLVELKLANNRLTDVPTSISLLRQLGTLDLSVNRLAEFPTAVLQLVTLTVLNLSENTMRSSLPQQIGRMGNLNYLNLRNSGLSGGIPVEIGNVVNLEFLDLSQNGLTGSLPVRMGLLVHLKSLFVHQNQLSGWLPEELSKLDLVEDIRLDHNDFSGSVPTTVCELYNATSPAAYIDCEEVSNSECFNYCCTDAGCSCRYEKTDPFRCLRGLK